MSCRVYRTPETTFGVGDAVLAGHDQVSREGGQRRVVERLALGDLDANH